VWDIADSKLTALFNSQPNNMLLLCAIRPVETTAIVYDCGFQKPGIGSGVLETAQKGAEDTLTFNRGIDNGQPGKFLFINWSSFKVTHEVTVPHDVSFVAFSPNTKYAAYTSQNDSTIRIAELDTWKTVYSFKEASGAKVTHLAFDPDGSYIAVGLDRNADPLALWKIPDDLKPQIAEKYVGSTNENYSSAVTNSLDSDLVVVPVALVGGLANVQTENTATKQQQAFDQFAQRLNLTGDQRPKVKAILDERNSKISELRKDMSLSTEDRSAKLKVIRDDIMAKMKDFLTPEQFDQWQKMSQSTNPTSNGNPASRGNSISVSQTPFEKLTFSIPNAKLFDNHTREYAFSYDQVWGAVSSLITAQNEKVVQTDKDTGVLMTDVTRHGIIGFPSYDQYCLFVEKVSDTSTKVTLKVLRYYVDFAGQHGPPNKLEPQSKELQTAKQKISLIRSISDCKRGNDLRNRWSPPCCPIAMAGLVK